MLRGPHFEMQQKLHCQQTPCANSCEIQLRVCGLQGDGQYSNVYRLAEAHFMHIREAVAQESAPATLKAAFLEPVSRGLATDLSVHLFARTDQQFMSWFTCALLLTRVEALVLCQCFSIVVC